jgi:hypothetical protein
MTNQSHIAHLPEPNPQTLFPLVFGTNSPANSGIGSASTTTLCPKSVPQTPQREHPSKEQSGTVAASKAFCKSIFSQFLSIPVSK